MTKENRNGRNGILTSWKSEAIDEVKTLYLLYAQFKNRIYLEEADKEKLLRLYLGKAWKEGHNTNRDKNRVIRNFLERQFLLMGYPKSKEYIQTINGVMVLDFGKNEESINKEMFNEYHGIFTKMKGGID